jgi:replicative DNA helicase
MPYQPDQILESPAIDFEEVQSVVVAAALGGDSVCLTQLAELVSGFEEPYRTVACELLRLHEQGAYVDRNVLGAALAHRPLVRTKHGGYSEQLTPRQALALVTTAASQPGQAVAYLGIIRQEIQKRRREEQKTRVTQAVQQLADQPDNMLRELQGIVGSFAAGDTSAEDRHPIELLELIPYAAELESRQRGVEFQGLDSGFQHINYLCNGLDTGLMVIAAAPGTGKTTLVWQMCCQAAELNQLPVIYISMEQSKSELRAKALARLSKQQYRHILRGRFQAKDKDEWPRVLGGLNSYGQNAARHLTIVEGGPNTTLAAVREIVAAKKRSAQAD